MRTLVLLLPLAAACSKPVDDAAVVEYLRARPADARARLVAEAEARPEQAGVVRRGDTPLTLVGKTLAVGDEAPAVQLADPKLGKLDLGALRGKRVVLSVVPSIDTKVCEVQTHKVSDAIEKLPPGTQVITVSRDLPFAQGRFAEEAMTRTQMGSDYHGGTFGRAFGLEIKETGLLARSVWVIGSDGKIAYRQLVEDQTQEPDYEALVAAAHAAR